MNINNLNGANEMRIMVAYNKGGVVNHFVMQKCDAGYWIVNRFVDPIIFILLHDAGVYIISTPLEDLKDEEEFIGLKVIFRVYDEVSCEWYKPSDFNQLQKARNADTDIQPILHHDHDIGGEG